MYAGVEWMVLHGQVRKAETLLTQLEEKKAIVLQENELLRHEVEHIQDADVMAHLARQKLGLVAPDEIIFIDVSNQTGG
jgi:cell division protein FtsB